jgi:hypothetical protein
MLVSVCIRERAESILLVGLWRRGRGCGLYKHHLPDALGVENLQQVYYLVLSCLSSVGRCQPTHPGSNLRCAPDPHSRVGLERNSLVIKKNYPASIARCHYGSSAPTRSRPSTFTSFKYNLCRIVVSQLHRVPDP